MIRFVMIYFTNNFDVRLHVLINVELMYYIIKYVSIVSVLKYCELK